MTLILFVRVYYFQRNHGYLFYTGFHVYIWRGIDAARETAITAITQSNVYFRKHRRPLLPVTIMKAGQEMASFNTYFFEQEEELDELKARLDEQFSILTLILFVRVYYFQHNHGYLFYTGFHVYIWRGIDAARETETTAITQSNDHSGEE